MNTSLFISEKIKVGFQNRSDTYNGKLAYVISMTNKGKLRKEKSFESWRDHSIEPDVYENEPISGFVLNKKAGGYSSGWNHRKTYVRVYDPRGFEFEITVENLLYILEHTSSIVGKGLEGEFIYSWSGKDLVLLPANAPEYEEIKEKEKVIQETEFVKAKDLEIGATYLNMEDEYLVYLGKFDEYKYDWRDKEYTPIKKARQSFHFSEVLKRRDGSVQYYTHRLPSISRKLVKVVDSSEHPLLSEMMESLSKEREFSPVDSNATIIEDMTLDDFLNEFNRTTLTTFVAENNKEYTVSTLTSSREKLYFYGEKNNKRYAWEDNYLKNHYEGVKYEVENIEDIYPILKPKVKKYFLESGHLYDVKTDGFGIEE